MAVSVSADCPVCGREGSLTFESGVENGAPHGAGFWPMPYVDGDQQCDCELTDEQMDEVEKAAWATLPPEEIEPELLFEEEM